MKQCLFIFFLFSWFPAFSDNSDSTLNSVNRSQMLFLNIPSTDCINCRMSAANALKIIKQNIDSTHVVLLTDHPSMRAYFRKYPEIYSSYKILVDEKASELMSNESRSTLILFSNGEKRIFSIAQLSDSTLQTILSAFTKELYNTLNAYVNIKDSASFPKFGNDFITYKDNGAIYSRQMQNALCYKLDDKTATYIEPTINELTYNSLINSVNSKYSEKPVQFDEASKRLNELTLPIAYVYKTISRDGCIYMTFYINTIVETYLDHKKNVSIIGRNFVAWGLDSSLSNTSMLNLSKYKHFMLLDSFENDKRNFYPHMYNGFDISGTRCFLPVRQISAAKDREPKETTFAIAHYELSDGHSQRPSLLRVTEDRRPDDFFIRVFENDSILLINKASKILSRGSTLKVKFHSINSARDTLEYIYNAYKNNVGDYIITGLSSQKKVLVATLTKALTLIKLQTFTVTNIPSEVYLDNTCYAVLINNGIITILDLKKESK